MDNFLLLKLNRSIWVALLEQEKVLEGINYFENYQNDLISARKIRKYKTLADDEIQASSLFFTVLLDKLAKKYFDNQDWPNALICYTALFKHERTISIIKNYIKCLDELNMFDLEVDLLVYLETLANENNEINKLLSETYNKQKNIKYALASYKKYIENKPQNTITANEWNQLGCYYNTYYSEQTLNRQDCLKSLECFEKAAFMEPNTRLYHKNATIMATKANEFEISKKHWDKLLELNVLNNDDKYDFAAFCLRTSDFENWHKYYDSRFQKEHNRTYYPVITKPVWDGKKKLTKATLLVHCEQGYGDTFLAWGHIPKLTNIAKKVIFVVQDQIYDLLKNNEFGIEVYPKTSVNLNTLKFDYHIPAMSVTTTLKLSGKELCVGAGYIKADENLVKTYKEKYFNNDKLKIGIAFAGNISGNKTRNINIEQLLPLDKLKDIEIYSLTKDVADDQFKNFTKNHVHNLTDEFKTFAHTAAIIENCDVIISTDNCILNLAAAMGKEVYGLFNNHYDFRWFGLPEGKTGWYTSVKPFINETMNDWKPSIEKITQEISSKTHTRV
ncbi:MAG: hypothetical protein E7Z87_07045 [Cyanobacteria bacterium SIG26]|nr:hypothetical protein [Cyanobacteria bacterium SIG26]